MIHQKAWTRLLFISAPTVCITAFAFVQNDGFSRKKLQHFANIGPVEKHITLNRPENRNSNHRGILVVGDVHGCLDELKILHKVAVEENSGRDFEHVILVGDLVNKGPKSAEVVKYCRSQKPRGWLSIRGNHDNGAIKAALGDPKQSGKSKYSWVDNLNSEDVAYMTQLPYTIRIPGEYWGSDTVVNDILIVHAGLLPGVNLEDQTVETMVTVRNVENMGNGRYEYQAKETSTSVAWAKAWGGPEHIIFGHDAKRKLQLEPNATGLDTGACYGFELTGVILPENRRVSVKSLEEYCPIGSPGC